MKHYPSALLLAMVLLATACSGGTTTLIDESAVGSSEDVTAEATPLNEQPEPTVAPSLAPTPAATPTADVQPTPTAEPTPVPVGSWADALEVGDCFDNVSTVDGALVAGPAIDCQGQHEYEIFFLDNTDEGPDAAYPSDAAFTDRLFDDLCDPAMIEFAGVPWETVPFGATVWIPTQAQWEAGDRAVACIAEAGLRDENIYKVGTAAAGTLTSDEGIVARATVAGQRDFFFSFQGSTLYPLTSGDFDLPNTSPEVVGVGFLFASPRQDSDVPGAAAYSYMFDTGEVTQLETGLDGYELASPHFVDNPPAFVFAARETPSDDWDIYLARSADDVVALTGSEADDKWPSVTPDGTQIVYHSDDDIWIMNVDGSDKQQLTSDPGGDYESEISPDGTKIVFASDRSGNDDVWIMNIDGSEQQNLTNHPANDAWPFFSLDGSLVYFQSDRLGVNSNIMVMEADGSNVSYYSFEFMSNAAVIPDPVTAEYAAELPTIADVLASTVKGVVPGDAGVPAEITHSSGRLAATVPGGWQYEEIASDDPARLVVAPSIVDFKSSWAVDGALITLIEADDLSSFTDRLDTATAATDAACAADGESTDINGGRTLIRRRYDCGAESTAIVVGVFEADSQLGVLFEGQWDNDPTAEESGDVITAIGASLRWG